MKGTSLDEDGVIVLDDSSSSDDDADGGAGGRPQAARKSAVLTAYDSDEHAQYLVRELMSSGGSSSSGGDSDAYDDDAAFDGARAFGNKRKRASATSAAARKLKARGSKSDRRAAKLKKQTTKHAVKRTRYVSADEGESDDSSDDGGRRRRRADSSESDSYESRPRPKAMAAKKQVLPKPPAAVAKHKKQAKAPPRTPEYIDVLSDSDEDGGPRLKQQQKTPADKNPKKAPRHTDAFLSVQQLLRHSVATETLPRKSGTPASGAYSRMDHAFHQLTEKLSFSELQAQRRELEQISLMHKRAAGGGSAAVTATAPPAARKAPRLESRKSVAPKSRVDEIEKRAKAAPKAVPALAITPSSREVVTRAPASVPSSVVTDKVIASTSSSNSSTTTSALVSAGAQLSVDIDRNRLPVMHGTAWRRLRFKRAPPNILSPEAEHLVLFADEFDRPLPDFDPAGALEKKTQLLPPFGHVSKTMESLSQADMNDKVQQLIAEALPLLNECHERRVRSILRGTREKLQSYFLEDQKKRSQLLRFAIDQRTFDLTYSERSDVRRLNQMRRQRAPGWNAMVGQVRYFVSLNASDADSDAATEGDEDSPAGAALDSTETTSEQVVYPETVVQLSNDVPQLRKSWAFIGVRKNVHVADDPILRYIPYLGENTGVNIDPNRYSSTTMDKSKRVELIGSQNGSVLELKSVATSALDDELMEYLLRFVVRECGDSKKVYEALQQTQKFSQPYSDYCEIKKNDDAGRRLVRRVTGMQRLMNRASGVETAECAAKIRAYLQALGSSCWFLQPRAERKGLANRLKPPIPFFESNYSSFSRGGGLRDTKIYSESTEWFRDLFCRRCFSYDCDEHGIMQPTPLRRADPINPIVRKAGLALRDNPIGRLVDMTDGDENSAVIELTDSSSSDDELESAEQEKTPNASVSASDDESSARRRSRRSQTRISSLASASLKVQEKMQEKERRRQRRVEAKQLKQLTRGGDDSEYLDDSYMDTVMEVVQALMSKEATCGPECWKSRESGAAAAAAAASTPTPVADSTASAVKAGDPGAAPTATPAAVPVSDPATAASPTKAAASAGSTAADDLKQSPEDDSPMPEVTTAASAATATSPPVFNDAEALLMRKLSSTLGDNACLIAAMLRSASCTCERVAQFLDMERQVRLTKAGGDDDDKLRSMSADMSNRRRQKSERRSHSNSFSGNRELLKRTRAQRNHDKGNKHSYQPCNHEGVCDGCECVKRGHHCDKACSCPRDCPNRFQGCKCSLGNCRTKTCPCYSTGRECDPDFCFSCGASDAAVMAIGSTPERRLNYDVGICCNANLLRGAQRKMGISFSTTHGWGAFALEPIRKGEFLYEYTGALISDDEAERRGSIYDVMAISFLFDVNCDEVVDATRKGNKSKFANHKALEAANCEAKILLVNGEHRIALYARDDIAVGEELFFDYGYTHETAPTWSKVEIRRGQRFEIKRQEAQADDSDDDDDDDDSD